MKTSKRKRSSKSAPVVEAALDSAPAAAASVEPAAVAVVAAEPANEPVVAEASSTAETVVAEAVVEAAAPETIVAEPVAEAVVADEAAAEASEPDAAEMSAPAAAEMNEPAAAELSEPATEESVAVAAEMSEPAVAEASSSVEAIEPVIVLAANCSVKDAAALKTSLCALVNESGAVTLDTSAVERVDTATMQLLCAFVRDRTARNQSVVWRGVSEALNDAVRLLGVAALLGFDTAKGVAA